MVARTLIFAALLCAAHAVAQPLTSAFTYQGELQQAGAPANGQFDFQFELFDVEAGGIALTAPVALEDVQVDQGIFTVSLDFGRGPFAGDRLWLDVSVREGNRTGGFTGLLPRQEIVAAPYALHAEMVAAGAVGASEIVPSQVQRRVSGDCAAGTMVQSVNDDGSLTCVRSPGQALAWGYITSTGTAAQSFGVDQVTRPSTGEFEITLSTTFDGFPVVIATSFGSSIDDEIILASSAANSSLIRIVIEEGGAASDSNFYFVVFGVAADP
ncbi:MAG: hypothetical protein AAGA23_03955 [Pseudomonadota bacterium]